MDKTAELFPEVFAEIFALLLTLLIGLMIRNLQYLWKKRKLRRVFGTAKPEQLFVMLPDYELIGRERYDQHRLVKYHKDGKAMQTFYGADQVYAQMDVAAALKLSGFFRHYLKGEVQLTNDKKGPDEKQHFGFIIGSQVVNRYTLDVMKQGMRADKPSKTFLIAAKLMDKTREDHEFYDTLNGQYLSFDAENKEYAALVRTRNPYTPRGFLFLVFGFHDQGTFAAARYLSLYWKTLPPVPEPFCIILEMPPGEPEKCTVWKTLK